MATQEELLETMKGTVKTRSECFGSLHSSQFTLSSAAAARAQVKAEAARVKLSFAQEANILKQQAEQHKKQVDLDADLHVLKSQKQLRLH